MQLQADQVRQVQVDDLTAGQQRWSTSACGRRVM